MKYLNRFNEGISWNKDKEELQNFCDDYLAYLKDDGFSIKVRTKDVINEHISIRKNSYKEFKWSDIKYDFIPFLSELIKKYDIMNTKILPKSMGPPRKPGKLIVSFFKIPNTIHNFTSEPLEDDDESIDKLLSGVIPLRYISEIQIKYR